MNFASDNTSGAHPRILQAIADANSGRLASYGDDALTARAVAMVREAFSAPEAAVYLVATGTAANSLALASLCRPFDAIFCTAMAHIQTDECNAPEFFTGGAKLITVPDDDARMTADALRRVVSAEELRGVHGPRRGPVSITSLTERGTLYSLADTVAIAQVCRDFRLALHLDGARLANAAVALHATAAEISWHVGVDAVSFGGSKNGCLALEAVVFFDPAMAVEFERRRKRAGHLFSKHRFLAAQMIAYLEDGLWLQLATHANAMGQRLREGLRKCSDARLPAEAPGNLIFVDLPRGLHRAIRAAGADYHMWDVPEDTLGDGPDDEMLAGRLVCAWDTTEAEVDALLTLIRRG